LENKKKTYILKIQMDTVFAVVPPRQRRSMVWWNGSEELNNSRKIYGVKQRDIGFISFKIFSSAVNCCFLNLI